MVEMQEQVKELYKRFKKSSEDDQKHEKNVEEVILFFSFDVVNSSMYKSINYNGWATVLTKLFDKLQTVVKEQISNAELWRVLGDEAVFIVRVLNEEEIFENVDKVFRILDAFVHDIKTGVIFEKIPVFSEEEINLMKLQNIISLKGAMWIAVVAKGENVIEPKNSFENITAVYTASEKYKIFEFLGNDIDTGFRLSKKTCDRRMVINFELAYILSRRTNYLSNLFIITYKRLKGVWKNRLYPIIWYYDKKVCNDITFEDSFYYDELEECELSREFFSNRNGDIKIISNDYMVNDVNKALNKILTDQNLQNKIDKIYTTLSKATSNVSNSYINTSLLELHCVAICFDQTFSKVLIAQRSRNKQDIPGRWEFGCAKANLSESISETLKQEYSKDFDIEIEMVQDPDRTDNQPYTIALYEMQKVDGLHKGIIVLAQIISGENLIDNGWIGDKTKHQKIRWIKKNEVNQFTELSVDNFKETLNKAFNEIEKLKHDKDVKSNE